MVSIAGIGGGVIFAVIVTVFGSSQFLPILIIAAATVISLLEFWWLNFRYFPSE